MFIRKSNDIPAELKDEFQRTEEIVLEFVKWLQFCLMDTARDSNFQNNHLLSFLYEDIVETLMGVLTHVVDGIHTPSIRESRYLLELSIKVAFIQQENYQSSIEDKLISFDREIKSPSIAPMRRINFNYFSDTTRTLFIEEVGRLYGEVSSFVHVTPTSIEYRQSRLATGNGIGKESVDNLMQLNDLLRRIYATAIVFLSHSVPQYVIGDWLVDNTGELSNWYYLKSKYISEIDQSFDYKFERRDLLEKISVERASLIEF